jgi:hypothetical protein
MDPQRETGDHTNTGSDILQSIRTRPDLTGDFRWVILYALLSLAWLGLICLVAPSYLTETMMTARLTLLAGGIYCYHDIPDLRHQGFCCSIPFATTPYSPPRGNRPRPGIRYPRHYWLRRWIMRRRKQLVV